MTMHGCGCGHGDGGRNGGVIRLRVSALLLSLRALHPIAACSARVES